MKSDILEAIKKLNRGIKRQESIVNPDTHGRGQGKVLHIIMKNKDITAKELAMLLDIRPPSLTEKLDKLEADGNIIRTRDRRDMRVVHISITEQGKEAVYRRAQEKDIVTRDFSDCLSEEDREVFCALCAKMSSNIEGILRDKKEETEKLVRIKQRDMNQSTDYVVDGEAAKKIISNK